MKKINFNEILTRVENEQYIASGKSASSPGKCSVSVVNNRNGHRLSISQALANDLDLQDSVCVAAMPKDKMLLIGKNIPNARSYKLSGSPGEKRICYSASLSQLISDAFQLDYSNCSSKSFSDVSVEKMVLEDGSEVAIAFVSVDHD